MRPEARKIGIVAQDVEGEVLVYDLERDEAHCLNQVTSLVWRHADGKSSVATIVDAVGRESPGEVDQAVVLAALQSLSDAHLLIEEVKHTGAGDAPSRRQMIGRIALIGGLTVAGIASIVAPTAAQTRSSPTPIKPPKVSPAQP
jgi:Coenzyme PQQ synthesis protein D (PqqD)